MPIVANPVLGGLRPGYRRAAGLLHVLADELDSQCGVAKQSW
jgi:hypothetical protein